VATFPLPVGYDRIAVVGSFDELVGTPMAGRVNAICWPRDLPGDFAEVLAALDPGDGISHVDEPRLAGLPVGPAGRTAVATLLADLQRLRERGHEPGVDCVRGYSRDQQDRDLPTDVMSFHVDSATVPTDTFLCTYAGAPSEGLRNDEAVRRIDDPDLRARLLARHGGADGDGFRDYLTEHFHDLHYRPVSGARPFSFGVGNLWRIAVAWPGCPVPPCVHRAPAAGPGEPPRLLLIS
jgi:hypothetical protein